MARGRKPVPQAIKDLRGTARKDRTNKEAPRPPAVLVPAAPLAMEPVAQAEWDRVVGELVALGIVTGLDLGLLAATCMEWEEYCLARAELTDDDGRSKRTVILRDKDGVVRGMMNHPAVARANAAFRNYRSGCSELGCTPASRERVKAQPQQPEDDAFADWEARKNQRRGARQSS